MQRSLTVRRSGHAFLLFVKNFLSLILRFFFYLRRSLYIAWVIEVENLLEFPQLIILLLNEHVGLDKVLVDDVDEVSSGYVT